MFYWGWGAAAVVGEGYCEQKVEVLSTSVKVSLNSAPDRDLIFWKSRKSSLLCRGCSHKVKFALANGKIAYSYLLIWSLFIQYSCNPLLIKYTPKYVWAAVWLCLCSRCQDSQASLQWRAVRSCPTPTLYHTHTHTHECVLMLLILETCVISNMNWSCKYCSSYTLSCIKLYESPTLTSSRLFTVSISLVLLIQDSFSQRKKCVYRRALILISFESDKSVF